MQPEPSSSEILAPERRIVTILAADIANSTQHIVDCDPEDALLLFDHWFEHFRETVERSGGKLVSYEGDGGIAVFGWPTPLEDHADRACAAAWDLQIVPERRLGPGGQPIRFRVGVHSGLAAVRRVDRDGNLHLNTVGATVNIAAKLQQAAQGGNILVSAQTAKLCRMQLALAPEEATEALRTIGSLPYKLEARPENRRTTDIAQRYRLPIVGRHAEVALLAAALPRNGQPSRSIALVGEPGIGKSRLAFAAVADAIALGIRHMIFFGDAQRRTTPFAAARHLVESLLDAALQPSGRNLRDTLVALSLDTDDIAALEAALASHSSELGKQSAALNQNQLARAFVNAFCALALDRPAILLVEDLQYIDPESRLFLRLLAGERTGQPLFLLMTGRPEARADADKIADSIIVVEPMPAADMASLGRRLWAGRRDTETMLEHFVARAEGIPFVLEELVRSVENRPATPPLALPPSVESVIHARLERLPPGGKALAQALSLLGENVDIGFVAAVMGVEEEALQGDLDALERFAFIHPPSQRSTHLRHHIIAEACANTIGRHRRRRLHAAAVSALLSRHSDLAGRYEQLAFHAEGAGDDIAALDYLWRAGLEARRSSAAASLDLIFDRALEVIGRIGDAAEEKYADFVLMAFASMVQLGEFDKVNLHLPRVMDLVRRFDRPALISSTLSQLGMICWFEGRYEEGLRATEEGIAIARILESPALIFSNQIMQSNILHGMGEVHRAIAEERALCDMLTGELEAARLGAAGIPSATALAFMSWFLVDVGQLDEGLGFAERALAIAMRERDAYSEALARNALGRNLLLLGRNAESAACLAVARAISERNGYDAIRPNLAGRSAAALSRIGRTREAIEIVEECLRLGLHERTGQLEVYNLHIGHAEALYRSGRTDEGLEKLADALDVARRTNSPCLIVDGLGLRARLLEESVPGDPRIAADLAERDAICARHGLVAVPAFLPNGDATTSAA